MANNYFSRMILHSAMNDRNFLKHHGVENMRWGYRRYQPYDIGYQGSVGQYIGPNRNRYDNLTAKYRNQMNNMTSRYGQYLTAVPKTAVTVQGFNTVVNKVKNDRPHIGTKLAAIGSAFGSFMGKTKNGFANWNKLPEKQIDTQKRDMLNKAASTFYNKTNQYERAANDIRSQIQKARFRGQDTSGLEKKFNDALKVRDYYAQVTDKYNRDRDKFYAESGIFGPKTKTEKMKNSFLGTASKIGKTISQYKNTSITSLKTRYDLNKKTEAMTRAYNQSYDANFQKLLSTAPQIMQIVKSLNLAV